MRICVIAPPWVSVPPPAYGGTEAVLDALARGLQDAGHDVLLVATGDSTCPVPTVWAFDEAVGVGVGGSPAELRHVLRAYEAAAAWGADIVHDNTLVGPLYACSWDGVPVVVTNHGPFGSPDLGPLYRTIAGRVGVIAISAHHASTAAGTDIAAVIHHGVDLDRFPVGPGGDGAVFLGRMHADKGVDAACRIARAAGIPLRIAAKMREPHEVAFFDEVVRPLLGGDVEYLGELGAADKLALLGGAACLLNPIRWPEPFGMVMIEALACGTPVVARACGSVPELIAHGVTGFVADDDDELAALVTETDRIDRRACRRAAEERFSATRMVADHLALYERLTSRASAPLLAG